MSRMADMCGDANPANFKQPRGHTFRGKYSYCILNKDHVGPHRNSEGEEWLQNITMVQALPPVDPKDFHDLVARVAVVEEALKIKPESGPKNPAYILGYNILLSSFLDKMDALHLKSSSDDWCDGCGGDWPCESRRAIDEHRELIDELQSTGALR